MKMGIWYEDVVIYSGKEYNCLFRENRIVSETGKDLYQEELQDESSVILSDSQLTVLRSFKTLEEAIYYTEKVLCCKKKGRRE